MQISDITPPPPRPRHPQKLVQRRPQLIGSRPSTSAVPKPTAPPAERVPVALKPKRHASETQEYPSLLQAARPITEQPVEKKLQAKPTKKRFKRVRAVLSYIGLVVLALALGLSFYDQRLGQWIVIGAGVVALVLRLPSAYLFGAALFMLLLVPITTATKHSLLSENYAVYTFLLLVFGIIRSVFEVKKTRPMTPGKYKLRR